jgi:hypothetical protein
VLLNCRNNILTNLELSNSPELKELLCSYNFLTSLDVRSCTSLELLELAYIPSLYKICVWTMPFPPAGVSVNMSESPNVYFTMDCN